MPATLRGCLDASSLLAAGRRCLPCPHLPLPVDKPPRLAGRRPLEILSLPRYTAVALLTSLLQERAHPVSGVHEDKERSISRELGLGGDLLKLALLWKGENK